MNRSQTASSAAGAPEKARRSGRPRRSPTRDSVWWAVLLLSPAIVGFGVFEIWPLFRTFFFSFTTWGAFGGHTWSGLDNYAALLSDPNIALAIKNTAVITGFALLGVPIAVMLAALLSQRGMRGVTIYRTLYFLPVVTLPAAVGLTWRWLFNGDFGLINWLLSLVGIDGPHWLSDPSIAIYSISIVSIWSSLGYNMVILLSGIQGIPADYYEAASIDGAGKIAQFRHITVPLLTPAIFFVMVITVISALKTFDLIFLMIASGVSSISPALPHTQTLVYLFYSEAFARGHGGYGAAISMLVLGLTLILTATQFGLQKKWVHYD
jgi:multiple sugar transport system permease protein